MKEKGSIYQLFRDLADFVKDHRLMLPEEEAADDPKDKGRPVPENTDEYEAFLEAMKDVRRVEPDNERVREQAREASPVQPKRENDLTMEEILRIASPFSVINLPEYMEGYVEGISPLTVERLRNGDFSVQKALDLHGLTAEGAYEEFHLFLGEAVRSQLRCVKIIHGRGLKSRGGPVLKEKLKEWIVRAMHRKWVVAFASCRMADGGPGATVILLRTRAHKKRLRILG